MKDGGPAFPHLGLYKGIDGDLHPTPTVHGGMTLRDWFAGQALAGMMARDSFDPGQATPEQRARLCYVDADAMLAERDK